LGSERTEEDDRCNCRARQGIYRSKRGEKEADDGDIKVIAATVVIVLLPEEGAIGIPDPDTLAWLGLALDEAVEEVTKAPRTVSKMFPSHLRLDAVEGM